MADVVSMVEELKQRRQSLTKEIQVIDAQLERVRLAVGGAFQDAPRRGRPPRGVGERYQADSATAKQIREVLEASPRAMLVAEFMRFGSTAPFHLQAMFERHEAFRRRGLGDAPNRSYWYAIREEQFAAVNGHRRGEVLGGQPARFQDDEVSADDEARGVTGTDGDPDVRVSGLAADVDGDASLPTGEPGI